jgi:glycosyltransferase involved in cell wall biosynthesis
MKITVCIGSVRADTLGATIASIKAQTLPSWELVVAGQGDDHAVREVVEAALDGDRRLRYVHVDRMGLGAARNVAMKVATGDVLAFTDDDCEADPSWLAVLARCFEEEADVGLVGGALLPPASSRPFGNCPQLIPGEALYDPIATRRRAPAGWDWAGGNFAVRAEIVDRVGQFDDCLGAGTEFPACEDTDYKLRLEAIGVRMRSTPRAVVYHTYGARYGVRALLAHQRNYARGNGAMAAKLTLLRDPRGAEWLEATRRECLRGWIQNRRPHRIAADLRRLFHFSGGYRDCLRRYAVDSAGLLRRLAPEKPLTDPAAALTR